jgi:hypothetical protein
MSQRPLEYMEHIICLDSAPDLFCPNLVLGRIGQLREYGD